MNCFSCSLNLCTLLINCDNDALLKTPLIALNSGYYILVYKYLDINYTEESYFSLNDKIEFDMKNVNENYCYDFQVLFNNIPQSYNGKSNFEICTQKIV